LLPTGDQGPTVQDNVKSVQIMLFASVVVENPSRGLVIGHPTSKPSGSASPQRHASREQKNVPTSARMAGCRLVDVV